MRENNRTPAFLGQRNLGSAVTRLQASQFVIGPFVWADGTCECCREGLYTSCLHGGFWATGGHDGGIGGQAETIRVPQANGTLFPVRGIEDAPLPFWWAPGNGSALTEVRRCRYGSLPPAVVMAWGVLPPAPLVREPLMGTCGTDRWFVRWMAASAPLRASRRSTGILRCKGKELGWRRPGR